MSAGFDRRDPAYMAMLLDVLGDVLGRAENPAASAAYLAGMLRELTGARCVLLAQCRYAVGDPRHRVVAVEPERLRGWAESPVADGIFALVHAFTAARVLRTGDPGTAPLADAGYGLSFAIPLTVGATRVGVLLVLGLPDEEHLDSELDMLETLSGVVALVLRTGFLFEEQERLIAGQTAALEAAVAARGASEESYRRLFESSPLGIAVGVVGAFHDANPAYLRLTGYTIEELRDLDGAVMYVDPEERTALRAELLAAGRIRDKVVHLRRRDGAVWLAQINADLVELDGQRKVLTTVQDITGQRAADLRSRAIIESSPLGMHFYELDAADRLVLTGANDVADRMLGLEHARLFGSTIEEAFPPLAATGVPDLYRKVAAGESGAVTFEQHYDDGRVCGWFEVTVFRIGERQAAVEFLDIDQRKSAEETIRESESRYRLLFENLTAGFALHEIILDGTGRPVDYRFLEINPAFERLTGLAAADLLGRTVLEALPGTEPEWIETYGQVALTGEPVAYQNYSRELDRHFEVWAFRPRPGQFAVLVSDVSPRVRLEEQRARLQAQLVQAQKLESVGTMASGVAHEINNPLTGIINYAQLLLDDAAGADAADAAESAAADGEETARARRVRYLAEIIGEGDRIAAIVRNLLAFSRQNTEVRRPHDIGEVVNAIMGLSRKLIEKDDITFVLEVPPGLPPVVCNPQQLQQVLLNLVTNARDALNTRYPGFHAEKVLRIAVAAAGGEGAPRVRVTVEDAGDGIPADVVPRLFDPFFTTKEPGKGTGLGLSISYGIVKEHGGEITVESETGRGTRFHVDLPAAEWRAE